MEFNSCRLCKKQDVHRLVLRYGVRHYCHAECGFERWGDDFLRKVYTYEIGQIPYRLIQSPARKAIALELCPANIRASVEAL